MKNINEKIDKYLFEGKIMNKNKRIDNNDFKVSLNVLHRKAQELTDLVKYLKEKHNSKDLKKTEDLMYDVLQSIIQVKK